MGLVHLLVCLSGGLWKKHVRNFEEIRGQGLLWDLEEPITFFVGYALMEVCALWATF